MSDLTHPSAVMKRPLCGCGCGRQVNLATHNDRANGYVKGQPFTYLRGHAPRATGPEYLVDENGCWVWQRSKLTSGYGSVRRRGSRWLAHRWYYLTEKGEIPEGLQLDHLCRNRSCVNPEHLEPVTNAENGRRGKNTKLTAEIAAEIRESKEDAALVAARYGIARSSVYNIRGGWTWKD